MLTARSGRVAAARRLTRRAARHERGAFLAEGQQAVSAGLAAGELLEVFVTPTAAARLVDLLAAVRAAGLPIREADDAALASLSETVTPQGLVAVARIPAAALDQLSGARLVAVLHEAQDPGNAGTVIRAADAAGADAVVLTSGSVDAWNGKCVRASAGSVFHLPIVTGVTSDEVIAALRHDGCQVLATTGSARRRLDEMVASGDLVVPTAWIFGNEAHGLPDEVLRAADAQVRVPVRGRAESLNLAGAATVCLYASAWAQEGAPQQGARVGEGGR